MSNTCHATATITTKMPKPISQRMPMRFRGRADAGEEAFPSLAVLDDERRGEPQRGQDLLAHTPRLEPHEVQYICFI
ncbi:MAG: hypothetical protein LBE22_04645 [Azoarcus sp.]|jgi:hypothetical protein|nr:hypothetical protein [Azoarcus sp.]